MTDNWSKDQTRALINLYRECECLYNVKHPDYLKKGKRNQEFMKIESGLKSIKPDVTIAAIKNKIRTLSTQISKERLKMRNSARSGAGADEVYPSRLWCFKELEFLFFQKDEKRAISNIQFLEEDLSINNDVEEAEEAAEVHISKKTRVTSKKDDLRAHSQKSIDAVNHLVNTRREKTKEDHFGDLVAAELKTLKLEETYDDVKIDILRLINEAKQKEKEKLHCSTHQDTLADWRYTPSASSTPTNISSASGSDSASSSFTSSFSNKQLQAMWKNKSVEIKKVQIIKEAEPQPTNSQDILAIACRNLLD